MRPPSSFKIRLLRSFFLFSGLLIALLIAFLFMIHQAVREEVVQGLMLREVEAWIARRAVDPAAPLPGGWIQGYEDPAAIPEPWRSNLHRFRPEDDAGIPLREWREVQLWRGTVPGAAGEVYLFAENRLAPGAWLLDPNLLRLLALALVLTLAFGAWLSRIVSERLARPLEQLQARIDAYVPGRTPPLLPRDYPDRELARLAQAFHDVHARIDAFVRREQEFTRHASHELRTPVTVIRTAGSVLGQHLEGADPRARRAVANLIAAADDMTRLINTFLWMAREEGEVERDATFDAGAFLALLCERHRLTLRPGLRIALRVGEAIRKDFPGTLFGIAAANLVRNACQHAGDGTIEIDLLADRLDITNPLDPQAPAADPSERAGLGLGIVGRIAARCGWTFAHGPDPAQSPPRWRAALGFAP
jgi:signal transduction histidine kinase